MMEKKDELMMEGVEGFYVFFGNKKQFLDYFENGMRIVCVCVCVCACIFIGGSLGGMILKLKKNVIKKKVENGANDKGKMVSN